MVDIKWTWNFDVYDESDSPTEEGYYRIIDDEGNEMTDYYFNEPKMTPHGVGYWRDGTRPIIAWRFLGKTENCSEKPNNWDEFFREPTAEERKAVADYIDSISVPTGVNIFDLMEEPQTERSE